MLKMACLFTGDNFGMLNMDTPASKKKVVTLALAMIVPVLIWAFNGFMLSYLVLESGRMSSVITGLVCGILIFLIEKLIVMSNGNRTLTIYRIAIGFIVALLGSIAIDEVIFKNDIDTSVEVVKENNMASVKEDAAKEFKLLHGYAALDRLINAAQVKYNDAEKAVIDEANGTYGTGVRGAGKITRLKDMKATSRKEDLNKLLTQKAEMDTEMDNYVTGAGTNTGKSFNEHGLLIRVKALFRLVLKDWTMLIAYSAFSLLLFFIEFLVVILKKTMKKTNYEYKMEMIDEIGNRRMAFLLRKDSPLTDPGNFLPQFETARQALKKNSSLYN